MENKDLQITPENLRRRNRRSFLLFALYFVIVAGVIFWLKKAPQQDEMARPLRKMAKFNEHLFGSFFSDKQLAKEYSKSEAVKDVRVNGDAGMGTDFKVGTWKLKLIPFNHNTDTLFLTLDDIKKLPKTEIVFDFKCIEGWSQVTHWGGVKLSDFLMKYHVASRDIVPQLSVAYSSLAQYVGMETPDKKYFVGIDMFSAMHPQTILCYEMNGKPLPYNQGAPLRLIIPVKYGIKSIKRIGTMFFSDAPPKDYWAEKGYDYYSGL